MLKKSKITLILCLSTVVGILMGINTFSIPNVLLFIFLSLFILSLFGDSQLVYFYSILLGLTIGTNRINIYTASQTINNIQSTVNNNKTTLSGIISKIPDKRNNKQKIILTEILHNQTTYQGNIIVITDSFPNYQIGDKVEIIGKISSPENFDESFNYPGYLSINQIYAQSFYPQIKIIGHQTTLKSILFDIRQQFIDQTKKQIPPNLSGLLTGLLVSDKNNLTSAAYKKFQNVGLTHIIVVSGYNLTIFAIIFNKLLKGKVYPIFNFCLTASFMLLFVILTGAEASIVRAFIMTIIMLIAPLISRKNNPTLAITFTATIMIYLNPLILWYDAGFHLSFLATAGLFFFSSPLEKIFHRLPIPEIIKSPLIETSAAQITTTPYIISSFHQLAIFTPLTNILVLPIIPYVMLVGFSSIIATFLLPNFITLPFTSITSLCLKYIFWVSDFFSSWKYSSISITLEQKYLLIYYIIITIFIICYQKTNDSAIKKIQNCNHSTHTT